MAEASRAAGYWRCSIPAEETPAGDSKTPIECGKATCLLRSPPYALTIESWLECDDDLLGIPLPQQAKQINHLHD
jgi:hypothetical protein